MAGSISREEFDELHARLLEGKNDAELAAWMDDVLQTMEEDKAMPVDSGKIFRQITAHPDFEHHRYPVRIRRRSYRYWLSGAAAMICIGAALFFYQQHDSQGESADAEQSWNAAMDVRADREAERAVLRLADGTEIDLEEAKDGLLSNHDGAQVVLEGNELSYAISGTAAEQAAVMNSVHIPKGKQYQIILPDGSKVWLNAASSLTYPVRFSENERSVEVQGEAYFEIVPDQQAPFIVHSATQKVEVLGTAFNISAYPDDGYVKTTLVNGSVRVSRLGVGAAGSEPVLLRPGQQSFITPEDSPIRVSSAETEEVISWKHGLFVFSNEPVEEVMRKVARWYNVEVEYRDGMEGKLIGGDIPRFEDIHKLMRALQATGLLRYQMEGGKIVIMK